jgi:aquaporin Z
MLIIHNDMPRRAVAEFFGTFWLTFAGCGSAVLAAARDDAVDV